MKENHVDNYHDKAEDDLRVARLLISPVGNPTNDEGLYDIAAYHAEQGVEKELKYILHDILGEDDTPRSFRTHAIPSLIEQVRGHGIDVPDALCEIAQTLTEWEAGSRYPGSHMATREEISSALFVIQEFSESIRDNLTYENQDVDNETDIMEEDEDTDWDDDPIE